MTRRLKTLAALGLPGLLLAGVLSLQCVSPDPAPVTGGEGGAIDQESRRSARLEEDRHFLVWSTAAKDQVTVAVVRRRLGLLEGAAALRAIDAVRPARLRTVCVAGVPARSEEERYCRSMIDWVVGEVRCRGADPARPLELAAELEDLLSRPDALRLPDVSLDRCLPPELLPAPSEAGRGEAQPSRSSS
jgi:hypothetical protein